MLKYIALGAMCVGAAALLLTAIALILRFCHDNKKAARVEGKVIADSGRLIWRIVNTGVRALTVVEIGIRCGDKFASYRPLFAATEDINNIPHRIERGDIASYRKEADRFAFRQSEINELKVSNPYIWFYAKDAEGTVYSKRSDYKFVQYYTALFAPVSGR